MQYRVSAEYAPPRYWEQFEELCADVFQSQFGDPALVRHGRGGQAQHGIDILARNGVVYPIGDAADFALFGAVLPPIAREFGLGPAAWARSAHEP